jgi:hypothetical protein
LDDWLKAVEGKHGSEEELAAALFSAMDQYSNSGKWIVEESMHSRESKVVEK